MLILIFLTSKKTLSEKVFSCCILIIGACEVGIALSLIVRTSRFRGIENIDNLKCEGF